MKQVKLPQIKCKKGIVYPQSFFTSLPQQRLNRLTTILSIAEGVIVPHINSAKYFTDCKLWHFKVGNHLIIIEESTLKTIGKYVDKDN